MRINSKSSKNKENNFDKAYIKSNLINNIPKAKTKIDITKKQIKNKRITNYLTLNNYNQNFNSKTTNKKENNFTNKKNISNHISINNLLLLSAYENSLLILFGTLKSYMKNDLLFFKKLKNDFIKNVQIFYKRNKTKLSISIPNSPKSYSNLTFSKKDNPHLNININKSSNNSLFGLSNNSLNKINTSTRASAKNIVQNNKKININNHKKSLYTLTKASNQALMPNNTAKNIVKKDYNLSILKSFIEFNRNVRNKKSKTNENKLINKTNPDSYNNQNNANNNITNINNINNNIYYNKIINNIQNIPNDIVKNDEASKENNLIACIKNSLDDNLKNMFDFSYQSFLNKESEREG